MGSVPVGGQGSSGVTFTVLPTPPQISALAPTFGPVGTVVTITGTNFGASQGNSTVTFNGIPAGTTATPTTWGDTTIVTSVPSGITPGDVNLVVTIVGVPPVGIVFFVGEDYHLHDENQLQNVMTIESRGPNSAATSVSAVMTNLSGEQLVKAYDTYFHDPHRSGILPAGSKISFTVWMRKSANIGTMVPLAKLYVFGELLAAPGILLCSTATGPGPSPATVVFNSSTPTKHTMTCVTTSDIPGIDQLYLWVGVNITAPTSSAVTAYVHFEGNIDGTKFGNYDSYVMVPLPSKRTVTSVSPNFGPVGTPVTFTGTSFGNTQGGVGFSTPGPNPNGNVVGGSVISWSDTSITALVPAAAMSGDFGPGEVFVPPAWPTFLVTPTITNLNYQAPIGGIATITGTGFGATQTGHGNINPDSTITLNGVAVTPTFWSINSIQFQVPVGATTGPVVVTVVQCCPSGTGNMYPYASNSVTLTVPPRINSVSPSSGPPGTMVTLGGTSFGATQGTSILRYNGAPVIPSSWSDTSIVVQVPFGATRGVFSLVVGGVPSEEAGFEVPVSISSLQPTFGPVGSLVTINGSGFGAVQGTSQVWVGLITTSTSWSDTQIIANVPAGAKNGNVYVVVQGLYSNPSYFIVTPKIDSLSPSSGLPGENITITGTNFDTLVSLTFNGIYGNPSSWSATSIVVPVPSSASTGPVVVTTYNSGKPSNGVTFTILVSGSATGVVNNLATGLPVSSALVSITDSGGFTKLANTDINGGYTIANLREGNFTGAVTKAGYLSYIISGVITAGSPLVLNSALTYDYPVISNLNVTDIGDHAATIHWTTNKSTDNRVDYGTTSDYGTVVSNGASVTDHSIALTGLASGATYHFKVTSKNSVGASSSSADTTFATTSPITLTITSPLEGETIGRSDVLVKGILTDSVGQEMGVKVNGVLGSIYGGYFVANHVPLGDGANTLTVTATDNLGNIATASVNVQSVPATNRITLSANVTSGVAPLQTTLKIDSTFPFTASTLSYSGPGSTVITGITASEHQVNIGAEGIHYITASVTDVQNVVHTDTVAITALNFAQMDTLLQGKWNGMKAALTAGNIEAAMLYFMGRSQERYQAIFQDIQFSSSQVFASIESLHLLSVGNDEAEMEALRTEGGIVYSYPIILMRDETGMWRIWGF